MLPVPALWFCVNPPRLFTLVLLSVGWDSFQVLPEPRGSSDVKCSISFQLDISVHSLSESGCLNKALLCIAWICIKPSLLRLLNSTSSSYLSEILASLPLFILCSNYCDFSLSILSYPVYSWLNKLYQSEKHNRSDLKTYWMNTLNAPVVYENNVFVISIFLCTGSTGWWLCITQWVHLTLDSLWPEN